MARANYILSRAAPRVALLYILVGSLWLLLRHDVLTLIAGPVDQRVSLLTFDYLIYAAAGVLLLYLLLVHRQRWQYNPVQQMPHENEEALRTAVAGAPDIITVLESDGRVRFSNPALYEILGYAPQQQRGTNFLDLIHPDDRAAVMEHFEAFVAGTRPRAHLRLRAHHIDGHWIPIEMHARAITNRAGQLISVIAVSRDVSEWAKVNQLLQHAKQEAERANRAKSLFLSRMSHELRTPLNAVLGFAQLLAMEELNAKQRESVEHILKGGRHLLDLINEVLDIARIEAGNLSISPEPIHVASLIHEAADLIGHLARHRQIRLRVAIAPPCKQYVVADRQRLKQVVLNLLSNAIKYNYQGGMVTITCVPGKAEHLRIQVSDTGPGISPRKMERLFRPFERLGAEQTDVEGTGLGLTLSRSLIEAMGGTIGVESVVGQGTTFWIELPIVEEPSDLLDASSQMFDLAAEQTEHRVILYIEDNLSNFKMIEQAFAKRPGTALLTAMQGRLGLDLAREHHPDLILLDLHLPDLAGDVVLKQLQAEPLTRDVPVVVISADATKCRIEHILESGARAYLTKPLDLPQFLSTVESIFKEQQWQKKQAQ